MSESIPCQNNQRLLSKVEEVAEALKVEAHTVGKHGLTESEFYDGGVFRGAVERLRGQFSATMGEKRLFVSNVLNHLEDLKLIIAWESAGEKNRHDYMVRLNNEKLAAIELKGCLDGNNTTIFERPDSAHEFILWSVCTNPAADPRHNVWSGVHTRLSAEIVDKKKQVDGLIVWDWLCGSPARPCPKIEAGHLANEIAQYVLPPPCLYLFPTTVPNPRTNPNPRTHDLEELEILRVFHEAFGKEADSYLHHVYISAKNAGNEIVRQTTIERDGVAVRQSTDTPIRRS